MRFPSTKWKWIGAALLASLATYSVMRVTFDRPSFAQSADAQLERVEFARLVIWNHGAATIHGRVQGPDETTRPFFVLPNDLHEMLLPPGVFTVDVDGEPASVRRVSLVRGETTTLSYGAT